MTLVNEKNYLKNNNFKVIRTETYVDDNEYEAKMKAIKRKAHQLKLKKLQTLKTLMLETRRLIDQYQLKALTTDDDREATKLVRYYTEILYPEFTHNKNEYRGLYKEIYNRFPEL